MSTQKTSPAPDTSVTDIPADRIGSGQEGSLGDQIQAYFQRLRSGDMGALPAVGGFVVLTILFSFLSPFFLTERNFANLLTQAATLVMLGMALVFVLLLGEIDLSVGAVSGVTSALMAVLNVQHGWNPYLAIAAAVALGIAIGVLQGALFSSFGVPSFVITLAGLLAWQGLQLYILGSTGSVNVTNGKIVGLANHFYSDAAGWVFAVQMTMGPSKPLRRASFTNSYPFITGMRRSTRMRSGGDASSTRCEPRCARATGAGCATPSRTFGRSEARRQ